MTGSQLGGAPVFTSTGASKGISASNKFGNALIKPTLNLKENFTIWNYASFSKIRVGALVRKGAISTPMQLMNKDHLRTQIRQYISLHNNFHKSSFQFTENCFNKTSYFEQNLPLPLSIGKNRSLFWKFLSRASAGSNKAEFSKKLAEFLTAEPRIYKIFENCNL